ncbi:MAG: hypothetical protein IJJ85_04940 [Clostridia bacterium]|nr:hypothetical protein [Clostridia bacterium]
MKKLISLIAIAIFLLTLCACGGKAEKGDVTAVPDSGTTAEAAPDETVPDADGTEAVPAPAVADVSAWNWAKGELDCFGNSECYLSFNYPDHFKTATTDESGEQYRGYFFDPSNADATANTAPYGIYVYFNQGAFGPNRDSIAESAGGNLTERELGGRTVQFGELGIDENNGSYSFAYYTSYSEDEWSRIWFIVVDPEPDGAFRSTFEQSLSFTK